MTFVEAAFIFPSVVCVIAVLWLLAYLVRNLRRDQVPEAGLEDLDELRWIGWTLSMGWPPVTCWHGCADLHRADWWRTYLGQTCWQGCERLHRADWWRAYVDQPD